ncbi:helix-turn-helix transcriptional regulator [Klebsiella aerogenes]|nr:helix-turn-helix transcriptional regulator [Klebsiella aerogenes]
MHNISDNTHQQYLESFQPLDPHLPAHFSHQSTTMAAMTPRLCDRNRHYYHEFMLPNNVRDMTEIFIRRERLTAKEREIVGMVREGASNKLIARQLDISLSTVKTHLRNIFAKTEVVNRTELVSRTWMPAAQRTLHL